MPATISRSTDWFIRGEFSRGERSAAKPSSRSCQCATSGSPSSQQRRTARCVRVMGRKVDEPAVDVLDLDAEPMDLVDQAGDARRRVGHGLLELADAGSRLPPLLLISACTSSSSPPIATSARRSSTIRSTRGRTSGRKAFASLRGSRMFASANRAETLPSRPRWSSCSASACGERTEPVGELEQRYPVTVQGEHAEPGNNIARPLGAAAE